MILAIDPGKEKCGLAFFASQGAFIRRELMATSRLIKQFLVLVRREELDKIIVGEGAFGQELAGRLKEQLPDLAFQFISEQESTRLARQRFWQSNPPSGWRRLIPRSLLFPPVPVDPFAAQIIGERYFSGL